MTHNNVYLLVILTLSYSYRNQCQITIILYEHDIFTCMTEIHHNNMIVLLDLGKYLPRICLYLSSEFHLKLMTSLKYQKELISDLWKG